MSSPTESFEFGWHASPSLKWLFGLSAALVLVLLLGHEGEGWLKLPFLLLWAGLTLWGYLGPIGQSGAWGWTGVRYQRKTGWAFRRGGEWLPGQLLPDTLVWRRCIILRFRIQGLRGARSVCLPDDAMSADAHRRLRVLLRFHRFRF